MQEQSRSRMFGGHQIRYSHDSKTCHCAMTFSVYLPDKAETEKVPALYWLSGLTCTDDNFSAKSGAQCYASAMEFALIIPDTSPRGQEVIDYPGRYDLGQGAGFYVDATESGWRNHFHMYSYINEELPALVEQHLPIVSGVKSISGHSMGGHGALTIALKNPNAWRSVSAFAPICNPVNCGWGQSCLTTYIGDNQQDWRKWDATCLLEDGYKPPSTILVHQGGADDFLVDQLQPQALQDACQQQEIALDLRVIEGYDHSYNCIASFFQEHAEFHQSHLR